MIRPMRYVWLRPGEMLHSRAKLLVHRVPVFNPVWRSIVPNVVVGRAASSGFPRYYEPHELQILSIACAPYPIRLILSKHGCGLVTRLPGGSSQLLQHSLQQLQSNTPPKQTLGRSLCRGTKRSLPLPKKSTVVIAVVSPAGGVSGWRVRLHLCCRDYRLSYTISDHSRLLGYSDTLPSTYLLSCSNNRSTRRQIPEISRFLPFSDAAPASSHRRCGRSSRSGVRPGCLLFMKGSTVAL